MFECSWLARDFFTDEIFTKKKKALRNGLGISFFFPVVFFVIATHWIIIQ